MQWRRAWQAGRRVLLSGGRAGEQRAGGQISAGPAGPSPTHPATTGVPASAQVGPSVDPDSATIGELNQWNRQYGSSMNKAGVAGHRLSYFT